MTSMMLVASTTISTGTWILIGVLVVIGLSFLALFGPLFGLWLQALAAHADVRMFDLIGMRLRKVDPEMIVLARIQAVRAGLGVSTEELESHYLAGGRPVDVIRAMIATSRADIDLTWKLATAIDLAGRNVLTEAQTAISRKGLCIPGSEGGDDVPGAGVEDGVEAEMALRPPPSFESDEGERAP